MSLSLLLPLVKGRGACVRICMPAAQLTMKAQRFAAPPAAHWLHLRETDNPRAAHHHAAASHTAAAPPPPTHGIFWVSHMSSRFTTPSCGFWQGWEGARSFVLFAAFALQNQKANARPHLVQLLQRLAYTLLVVIHLEWNWEEGREGIPLAGPGAAGGGASAVRCRSPRQVSPKPAPTPSSNSSARKRACSASPPQPRAARAVHPPTSAMSMWRYPHLTAASTLARQSSLLDFLRPGRVARVRVRKGCAC